MASSMVGALRVQLGLDSAQFVSGLKQSGAQMDRFRVGAVAAFAAASAAVIGAFYSISQAATRADDEIKAAQGLGVTIEELGRLRYALDLSGVEFGNFETAARRVNQAVGASLQGVASEGTRAFDRVGVSLRDSEGQARSMTDILGDVADRFQEMPDGAEKSALALQMFGRTGAQMIPFLNQGREGIAALGDEAERMGLVFDLRTGMAAERFNDNLTRLSSVMTGFWNNVLVNVIGGLDVLTSKLFAATQSGGQLDIVVQAISGAFNALARVLVFVIDNFQSIINLIKVFLAIRLVLFLGSVVGAFVAFARVVLTTGSAMVLLSTVTKAKIVLIGTLAAAVAMATGHFDDFANTIVAAGQRLREALPAEIIDVVDGLTGQFANLSSELELVNSGNMPGIARLIDDANAAAGSVGSAAQQVTQLDENLGGLEERSTTIADSFSQYSNTVASGLSDIFLAVFDGSKNAAVAANDLLSTLSRMALNQAFQGLLGGVMSGFGGSGGGFFPGLTGPSLPSFAGGGYTGSSGRTGGLDGMGGFLAMLHPNETVIDHKSGAAGPSSIHVVVGVSADSAGNMTPFVEGVSARIAGQTIPVAVEQSKAAVGKGLASGDYNRPMAAYGVQPQPRRRK